MEEINLYNMDLGNTLKFGFADVLRVPGGWIFYWGRPLADAAVFVPYHIEFKKLK